MTSSIIQRLFNTISYLVSTMDFIPSIPSFLMSFMSVVLEKTRFSCNPCVLLACVLSVAILYSRSGNFLLIRIQYYAQKYYPSILLHPICILNKALSSPKDRSVQLKQIAKWRGTMHKYYENQQRELKLLDQRDILDERRNLAGSLSSVEEAEYQSIKIQLSGIRPQLWENAQDISRLQKEWVLGPWTIEFSAYTDEDLWQRDKVDCRQRLGCCARSCGCCTRPRRGRNGRLQLLNPRVKVHCSIACSCCELWRNAR